MKVRSFFLTLLFLAGTAIAADIKKPNVVMFVIDDLGWADIGANGSTFHETPNIDALAAKGTNFKYGYSGHAVCSPTRAALMSGKSPNRLGITQWIHQPSDIHLPLKEVTIAEAFKSAGYKTAYLGKWHVGEKDHQLPNKHGFDVMKCVNRAGQPGSYFFPYKGRKRAGKGYWDVPDLTDGKKGDYLTDALTTRAMEFIDSNKEKPFFLQVSHYAVHTPVQSPPLLVEKYKAKRKKLFGDSETPWVKGRYGVRFRDRQDHVAYAAMIENLDMNIGRVIKQLEELNILENTIVVFTSDNGGHQHFTNNEVLNSGKGWNYEGGIRIPTIFYWKGKIRQQSSDQPAVTMDLYPTLLDLAGEALKPEQHLDGLSLKSVLLDAKADETLTKRKIIWAYPHGHGSGHKPSNAIRMGDWKLIRFDQGKRFELYNVTKDLGEHNDVADANPERVQEMAAKLDKWLKETTVSNEEAVK